MLETRRTLIKRACIRLLRCPCRQSAESVGIRLDEELPLWVPIPPLAEIQVALEGAVADVTQLEGYALRMLMRTGTVATTDNRNWELLPSRNVTSTPDRRFSQSRAIALDMESATIAANGFRFRVPYGTSLCVSDKPLHGEIKLPGMANTEEGVIASRRTHRS
jgi:AMP nucleosidase